MSWEAYALLLAGGVIGGFLAGLIGIGGGIIYVFVIPYALRYWQIPPEWHAQFTIANSLAAILVSSLAANYAHFRKGYFFPRPVFLIGAFAIASSWLTLHYVVHTALFSQEVFLVLLIGLLLYMLVFTLKSAAIPANEQISKLPTAGLAIIGVLSGAVAAASGLGGGIVVIPLLNRWFGINIRKAGAISMGVIMISSLIITFINARVEVPQEVKGQSVGLIIPAICLALSASVLITSPLGVRMAHRLPSKMISYIYAAFLVAIIADKIWRLVTLWSSNI